MRNTSIDAFRCILAFLVILLHSLPVQSPDSPLWIPLVASLCRVAVPFFFIGSGYFIKPNLMHAGDLIVKPAARLLPIYVFWMLVYFLFLKVNPIKVWSNSPAQLISGGAALHLWFLPALGFSLVMVSLGIKYLGVYVTGLCCLALVGLGLLRGGYHDVFFVSGTPQRGGLLFAPMFVFLGFLIRQYRLTLNGWVFGLIVGSYVILLLEEWVIYQLSAAPILSSHDFLAATFVFGFVCFLAILRVPENSLIRRLAVFGKFSLGIYASHLIFIWLLGPVVGGPSFEQTLVLSIATFLMSLLTTLGLMRIRGIKRLVV